MHFKQDQTNRWHLKQRAEVEDGTVAFDVFGEGPPVVLVHGTPSWSYLWRNVVPKLADRFTVYVFDLLGYGDSEPKGQDVSIAAQTRTLTELIGRWNLKSPVIAGHDIGGAVVLRSHLLDEVPFDHIALIDAVVLSPWITPTTRHVQEHLEVYRTMLTHIYERIVAAPHRDCSLPSDGRGNLSRLPQQMARRGRTGSLPAESCPVSTKKYTEEFESLLGSIRTPVKIIWGEEDAWLDPTVARRLDELFTPTPS